MVESSETALYRSSVLDVASKHLIKTAMHDFNKNILFVIDLASSQHNCRRLNLLFVSSQTTESDMLESTRFNLFDFYDLGQVQ